MHHSHGFDRCAIAEDRRIGKALDPAFANAGLGPAIGLRMLLDAMEGRIVVVRKPLCKSAAFVAVVLPRRVGLGLFFRPPSQGEGWRWGGTRARDPGTNPRSDREAFDELEARLPQLTDLATQGHVRESGLRLQKEIKEVQKEINEIKAALQKEIWEVEARLQREIIEVEARLQGNMRSLQVRLTQAIHRQTLWVIGAVGAIVGLVRLLDAVVK
jgi:hypothetical protein